MLAAAGVDALGLETMHDKVIGSIITWLIGFGSIYFTTHLVASYETGKYEPIRLDEATWRGNEDGLKQDILKLAKDEDKDKVTALIADKSLAELLFYYEESLKIAKKTFRAGRNSNRAAIAEDVAEA